MSVADLTEQDDVAAAVEGCRQAEMTMRSLMLFLGSPDAVFELLKPAFAEGAPHARARAISRRIQKQLEASLR